MAATDQGSTGAGRHSPTRRSDDEGGCGNHDLTGRLRTGPKTAGRGLGEGGERLHYWVFGGPWSYAEEPRGEATGADKEFLEGGIARGGAIVGGRNTYEAPGAWGGQKPFGVPFFIVTHRPDDVPLTPASPSWTGGRGDRPGARGRRRPGRVRHGRGRRHPPGAARRTRGGAVDLDCPGRARRGKRLFEASTSRSPWSTWACCSHRSRPTSPTGSSTCPKRGRALLRTRPGGWR